MPRKHPSLIGLPLDENAYRVDLELQDRYSAYSAEILRIALLGIAGYGFLLKDIVFADHNPAPFVQRIHDAWYLLLGGVLCLGVAAALALQHRVFATNCVACIAAFLRKNQWGCPEEADVERRALRQNLKWAARLLQVSAVLLALGAGAVVATFCYVLWR